MFVSRTRDERAERLREDGRPSMAYTTNTHSRSPATGPRAAAGATDIHDDPPTRCFRLTPDHPHGDDAAHALAADVPAEARLIAGRYQVERRLGGGGMA